MGLCLFQFMERLFMESGSCTRTFLVAIYMQFPCVEFGNSEKIDPHTNKKQEINFVCPNTKLGCNCHICK